MFFSGQAARAASRLVCALLAAATLAGPAAAQMAMPTLPGTNTNTNPNAGGMSGGFNAGSGAGTNLNTGTGLPTFPTANTPGQFNGMPQPQGLQGATPTQPATLPNALPPLGTNQFRTFVQDTTGQTLPLYGYNLFGNNTFAALTDVPVPANYTVGPGDEVNLRIWGSIDVALTLPVDRNGQITIPRAGPLVVAGTRADQLEARLKTHIGRLYKNFELSATLGRLRSIQVFVVGQARKPGVYTVSSLSTLISVLFESGGPTATGSMRQIQLVRGGKPQSTLDLYKFIHSGDTSGDARLLPGDVIVIPPAGPRVALLGALDSPAIYELANKEEPLSQVLAYSGGQQILTTSHKVRVERINAGQAKAPRQVEERTLDASGLASAVRDGDVVTLFKISPEFGNAVTLRGNVANPLRYTYRPGMRVSDLIPEVSALIQPDYYTRKNILVQYERNRQLDSNRQYEPGRQYDQNRQSNPSRLQDLGTDPDLNRANDLSRDNNDPNSQEDALLRRDTGKKRVSGDRVIADVQNMLDEINWEYASIERLDAKEVRTILIPFNLGKAIRSKDPAHDLQLQSGDVVTIFGVKDLPVPLEKRTQFVRVAGEVMVPGVYQLQPGDTLPQLIRRAGGFSSNAFPYGLVFTRETTRVQQQDNLDKSIRRLETEINGQIASNLQNVTDSEKGSAVQAQIAGQKILLDRLKGFKANGRIALGLDPARPVPPDITLEDGDQILVPNRPSFVGVFGEVMAETSFIHKPGDTVGNYLDKAGLTRDADADNIMLVRADGTAESNGRRSSWFGSAVNNKRLGPGDTIFVPAVIDRRSAYTLFIQGAKDWTSILYQFGLGAAALKSLGSTN